MGANPPMFTAVVIYSVHPTIPPPLRLLGFADHPHHHHLQSRWRSAFILTPARSQLRRCASPSPELSFSLTLCSGHLVLHHHHSATSISQSRSQTKPISDCPIRLDELVLNSSPPHLQFDTTVVQSTTDHLQITSNLKSPNSSSLALRHRCSLPADNHNSKPTTSGNPSWARSWWWFVE